MTKRKTETVNDLSRCLDPLDTDATLIAVIEMSQSSWLVAGIVPGVERQPLKKLAIDERALLNLLSRWRAEAEKKGHRITRIAVAFEAGHDGFWLARWLAAQGVEPHVIHSSSVAVTREHRRAKTDQLDTELLKRGFLGWLRGERGHCKMVAVPTLAEEDAKRPSRERGSGLVLVWKRLEEGAFKWPPIMDGVMRLSPAQLAALIEGLDWTRVHVPEIARPQAVQ